jgi:hypothetical protein
MTETEDSRFGHFFFGFGICSVLRISCFPAQRIYARLW